MLDGALSRSFKRRVVVLPPAGRELYRSSDWRGALVMVNHGEVVLESERRTPLCRLARGAVVSLADLAVHAIYNPGGEPAVLIAVWRRPAERTHREPESPT